MRGKLRHLSGVLSRFNEARALCAGNFVFVVGMFVDGGPSMRALYAGKLTF